MPSKVFDYIAREQARQDATVELIASENFVSENVLRAVGSCLTNKYAEGYPAERVSGNRGRYYGGCEIVNDLEEYCCAMWKKVFHTDYHVNVQPHSGANANLAAYMSVLQPGDTVLAMSLNNGGHLTHGSSVNFSGKLFDMKFYDVDAQGFIDFADVEQKAAEYKPKLILAGASAYSALSISRASQTSPKAWAHTLWWIWRTSRVSSRQGTTRRRSDSPTSSRPRRTKRCAGRAAA